MNSSLKLILILTGCLSVFGTMAQPINDGFANRTLIIGTNATVLGSLVNATSETGEPCNSGVSSGQTAWWTWTAPSNGIVAFSVSATNFTPFWSAYIGNDLPSLSQVASNNYLICYQYGCGCFWRERDQTTFHVRQGQAYQIAVDSALIADAQNEELHIPVGDGMTLITWGPISTTNVFTGGNIQLRLQFTTAPKNDDFEHCIVLAGSRTHIHTSNAGATKQSGEPDHLGNPSGSSVWFSWKAPASGRVSLSTNEIPPYVPPASNPIGTIITTVDPFSCGSEIDQNPLPVFYPVLAAYSGSNLNSLISANCLPMGLDAYPNAVEFDAIKGKTYKIAFDGNMGTTDDITLFLALTQPASNDNFKNRIVLHGIYAAASGFNAGATHESSEPALTGSLGKSVWWSWTAPVNGTTSIDLTGSDYGFPIAVFSGSKISNLSQLATGQGGASFEAVAGNTYQIAVGDFGGLTGAIKFTLRAPIIPVPLSQARRGGRNVALLSYTALLGQKLLLQQSQNGTNWQDVRAAVAHQNTVSFLVSPAPTAGGPFYRAIIVDSQLTH